MLYSEIEKYILAYLIVLDHKPTIRQLKDSELKLGGMHVTGCLHRVFDFFESVNLIEISSLIKKREFLNGQYGWLNDAICMGELQELTETLSEKLLSFLPSHNTKEPVNSDHKKFLDDFDKEFAKIIKH